MSKSAWDYTMEVISLLAEIDSSNDLLYKTEDIKEREMLSKKIDSLESNLFQIRNKLRNIDIT